VRNRTGAIASTLAVAALLWWFLRGISLGQVIVEIRGARMSYVSAAVALSLTGFLFRILRWRFLLSPLEWVRLSSLGSAVFIGWAVTAILPGRLGEIARAVQIRRRTAVRASAALGTIVLERALDVLALLILVAAALTFAPSVILGSRVGALVDSIRTGAAVVFAVLIAIATVALVVHRVPPAVSSRLRTWVGRLPGTLGRMAWGALEAFGAGLSGALRGGAAPGVSATRLRAEVALHTAILWATICAVHLLLFRAFDIEAPVVSIPLLLFLITLGLAVPVPAALGSYHTAVQLGLTTLVGTSNETAAGYAIVSHAVTIGPPALIGLVLLAREGLALSTWTSWSAAQSPDE